MLNANQKERRMLLRLAAMSGIGACTLGLGINNAEPAQNNDSPVPSKDFFEVVFARRSHRSFTGERASQEDIKKILAAGMSAPSANNNQPWEFIVIQNRDTMEQIANHIPMLYYINSASALIITCINQKVHGDAALKPISVTCCSMNIMLAIEALNYSSTWINIVPDQQRVKMFTKMFNIPEHITPFNMIVFGKPNTHIPPNENYQENKIHFEKW